MTTPSFHIIDVPGNFHISICLDGKLWRIPLTSAYAVYLIKQLANGLISVDKA